jgi:hypothetical protein
MVFGHAVRVPFAPPPQAAKEAPIIPGLLLLRS